jgi:hypothetical protein
MNAIDLVSMESVDNMELDLKNKELHEKRLERDK